MVKKRPGQRKPERFFVCATMSDTLPLDEMTRFHIRTLASNKCSDIDQNIQECDERSNLLCDEIAPPLTMYNWINTLSKRFIPAFYSFILTSTTLFCCM